MVKGFHPSRRSYPIPTNVSNNISNLQGWLPGTSQSNSIGIPHSLRDNIKKRTNTLVDKDTALIIAGDKLTEPLESHCNRDNNYLLDTKCLVVYRNQLSGVGRFRSQFNFNADGIKQVRYYLPCYTCLNQSSISSNFGPIFYTYSSLEIAVNLYNQNPSLATSIYGPINIWDTSNIINTNWIINRIFNNYGELRDQVKNWFKDPGSLLLNYGAMNEWDISNITSLKNLFRNFSPNVTNLTIPDISKWNTSKVDNISNMFGKSKTSSDPYVENVGYPNTLNLNNWDTSKIKNMSGVFNRVKKLNIKIGNWNTENVETMEVMFKEIDEINIDFIGNWKTQNVETMEAMFKENLTFNQNLVNWDVNNVTKFDGMFRDATAMHNRFKNMKDTPLISDWNDNLNGIWYLP